MKRLFLFGILLGLSLSTVSGALAQSFPITDVRALGMGGAFVAAGEGIGAVGQNPALLGKNSTIGVVLPEVILRMEDHIGLRDLVDDLNDLGPANPDAIQVLDRLSEGGSLDLQAGGSIGAGFGIFGISAGVTYSRMIYGIAMPANISTDLADLPDDGFNTLQYNAVDAQQLIFTGAKSFGDMVFGANLRPIDATLYRNERWLFDDPEMEIGDFTEGDKSEESATALDLGAFVNLLPMFDIGVVALNVNGPKLGEVEFDPRYRIGAALNLPVLTLAADLDVNETSLENGADYREWSLGAEFDIWAVALRAGLSRNSSLSGAPTMIHLGLGLGFLDLGAAYAEEGNYYLAGVNLALGF